MSSDTGSGEGRKHGRFIGFSRKTFFTTVELLGGSWMHEAQRVREHINEAVGCAHVWTDDDWRSWIGGLEDYADINLRGDERGKAACQADARPDDGARAAGAPASGECRRSYGCPRPGVGRSPQCFLDRCGRAGYCGCPCHRVAQGDEGECANCGKPLADACIVGDSTYDGEAVCSVECDEAMAENGCPDQPTEPQPPQGDEGGSLADSDDRAPIPPESGGSISSICGCGHPSHHGPCTAPGCGCGATADSNPSASAPDNDWRTVVELPEEPDGETEHGDAVYLYRPAVVEHAMRMERADGKDETADPDAPDVGDVEPLTVEERREIIHNAKAILKANKRHPQLVQIRAVLRAQQELRWDATLQAAERFVENAAEQVEAIRQDWESERDQRQAAEKRAEEAEAGWRQTRQVAIDQAKAHGKTEAELARERERREEAERNRDRYHDALIARHGGEPVDLLERLDECRARLQEAEKRAQADGTVTATLLVRRASGR